MPTPEKFPFFAKNTLFFWKKRCIFGVKIDKKMGRNSWFFYCFFSVFSKKNIPQTVEKSDLFFDPKIEKKGSVFDENPKLFIRPPGPMRVRSVVKWVPRKSVLFDSGRGVYSYVSNRRSHRSGSRYLNTFYILVALRSTCPALRRFSQVFQDTWINSNRN